MASIQVTVLYLRLFIIFLKHDFNICIWIILKVKKYNCSITYRYYHEHATNQQINEIR